MGMAMLRLAGRLVRVWWEQVARRRASWRRAGRWGEVLSLFGQLIPLRLESGVVTL